MGLTKPRFTQTNTSDVQYDDHVAVYNKSDKRKPNSARPDQGILFARPGLPTATNIGLIWDEPDNTFTFIETNFSDSVDGQIGRLGFVPVATGNITVNGDLSVTGAGQPFLNIYTGSIPVATGTSLIPFDATVPLISEGSQVATRTVTPVSAASKFLITGAASVDSGTSNRYMTFAVFRNSTCIATTSVNIATAARGMNIALHATDSPNTTSAVTYSIRAGLSSTATWYINRTAALATLHTNLQASAYSIIEYK
jgi:hypothetical protein